MAFNLSLDQWDTRKKKRDRLVGSLHHLILQIRLLHCQACCHARFTRASSLEVANVEKQTLGFFASNAVALAKTSSYATKLSIDAICVNSDGMQILSKTFNVIILLRLKSLESSFGSSRLVDFCL